MSNKPLRRFPLSAWRLPWTEEETFAPVLLMLFFLHSFQSLLYSACFKIPWQDCVVFSSDDSVLVTVASIIDRAGAGREALYICLDAIVEQICQLIDSHSVNYK